MPSLCLYCRQLQPANQIGCNLTLWLCALRVSALRQVGMPGEWGLSVEQRKRLTIAVELVANPSVVFMDEPTSGLDARAAAIVMRAVRNTVDTGRTVVCTIHQPSIHIFDVSGLLMQALLHLSTQRKLRQRFTALQGN
jgi:ABC-type multidrug transport system ATPase subunit